jgi:DDE domain
MGPPGSHRYSLMRPDSAGTRRVTGGLALATLKVRPSEVVTDKAPLYPRVLDELLRAAWHHVAQYENNRIEADHGRLKHRARVTNGPHRRRHHRRARLHTQSSPRPLPTSHRNPTPAPSRRGVRRTRPSNLKLDVHGMSLPADTAMQQRLHTRPGAAADPPNWAVARMRYDIATTVARAPPPAARRASIPAHGRRIR